MSHQVDFGYTLLMIAAVATCGFMLRRSQRAMPLSRLEKLLLGIGAFCGAMIGAKLPFVFSDLDELISGAAWFSNGKTIMFGIVGGYFGVELTKWLLEINVKTGDTFAAPVAFGVAIGRLACFQGGCCYGTPTDLPWGVIFPTAMDASPTPRHPTQLYESAFHGVAGVLLLICTRKGWFQGQQIKLYLIAYLLYRFATEFIRPEARVWWGVTGYQAVALTLIPVFAWLWYRDAMTVNRKPDHAKLEQS